MQPIRTSKLSLLDRHHGQPWGKLYYLINTSPGEGQIHFMHLISPSFLSFWGEFMARGAMKYFSEFLHIKRRTFYNITSRRQAKPIDRHDSSGRLTWAMCNVLAEHNSSRGELTPPRAKSEYSY